MNEDVTGTTALTIPDLQTRGDLVTVAVSQAAHDHLRQWSLSNRLLSLHEAGHCIAAAAASIPVRTVDITLRHGGATMLGGPYEDTSPEWETRARLFDRMMVAMAGAAAERQVLGEHTTGSESDFDSAVTMGMRAVKSGFGGAGLFVGEDGLPHSYLTAEIKTRTILRIQELVADAEARADALIATHLDALMIVATAIHEHRRLSDERLDAVLESAGFSLPRPTA